MEPAEHSFVSEFYVVEISIEVVVTINGQSERIKIDALKRGATYSTRAYIEQSLLVQPAFTEKSSDALPDKEAVRQWVNYDLPWTSRDSADGALSQALRFLEERCQNG